MAEGSDQPSRLGDTIAHRETAPIVGDEPGPADLAPTPSSSSSSSSATRTEDARQDEAAGEVLRSTKSKGSIYMTKPSHFQLVFSQSLVTPEVLHHHYAGAGTDADPYVVEFIENDARNPMTFSQPKKWVITLLNSVAALAVTFVSSAYSGAVEQVIEEFHVSQEVVTLGISLFVLGFAIGPLLWAPFSELFGRQRLFFATYGALTVLNAGTAGSPNIQTLLVLRFLAGAFGSSPLTNAGGVIADMFPGRQRGSALAIFAAAPFMGPAIGPIVGGFMGQSVGWRWLEGVMAIFTGVLWILCAFLVPETYAPVLLSKRAKTLSKRTGKVYKSRLEIGDYGRKITPSQAFQTALGRPWILLFREPIVLLLSTYLAILFGTLYMLFAAFPIVFQENRGWSEGIGGLSFVGMAIGFMFAVFYVLWDNKRYGRVEDSSIARGEISAPPEARLPPAMIGSILLPLGMFWFAWTNSPSIHWIVCIIATVPFGFGMLLVFTSVFNYLIDAYTVYAASVLAANTVLRSLFGTAFPLFTAYMYQSLGIHWASSIPAFLALMCVPFPFLFYKFGPAIRKRCKYAAQAMKVLEQIKESEHPELQEKESSIRDGGEVSGASAGKDVDLEAGAASQLREGQPMSRVATQKSMHSMRSSKNAPHTVRTRTSEAQLQLEKARSYASNF